MTNRIEEAFKILFRIIISALIIEVTLNLTCTYTIVVYHEKFLGFFSRTSLVMAHYLRGSLFCCKYVVYYGVPTLINFIIGMKINSLPRCISVMHTNGELWRYYNLQSIIESIRLVVPFFSGSLIFIVSIYE